MSNDPRFGSRSRARRTWSAAVLLMLVLVGCAGAPDPRADAWASWATNADTSACRAAVAASWELEESAQLSTIPSAFERCTKGDPGLALAAMRLAQLLDEHRWLAAEFAEWPRGEAALPPVAALFVAQVQDLVRQVVRPPDMTVAPDRSVFGTPQRWRLALRLVPYRFLSWAADASATWDRADAQLQQTPQARELPVFAWPDSTGTVQVSGRGIAVSETWLHLDEPIEAVVSVTAPAGFELRIGERTLIEKRADEVWAPTVQARRVSLSAGAHRVRVRSVAPASFSVRFTVDDGPWPGTFADGDGGGRLGRARPAGEIVVGAALVPNHEELRVEERALLGLATADLALLASIEGSTIPPMLGSAVAYARLDVPDALAEAWALDVLEAPTEEALPGVDALRAALLLGDGRLEEAQPVVARALAAAPNSPEVLQVAAYWAEQAGDDPLERRHREALAEVAPHDCVNASAVVAMLLRRGEVFRVDEWPEAWVTCEPVLDALVEQAAKIHRNPRLYLDGRQLVAASYPASQDKARMWLAAARAYGTAEDVVAAEQHRIFAGTTELQRLTTDVDHSYAVGDGNALGLAEQLLQDAAADLDIRDALAVGFLAPLFDAVRHDGLAAVRAYLAAPVDARGDVVFVLDAATAQFFEDGSSVQIVHQIVELRTRDALDTFGEVAVGGDELLLRLRTIKRDGRILVPEDISGEGAVSMPGLEIGDFIEVEFAVSVTSLRDDQPVSVTDRFYLQSDSATVRRTVARFLYPATWEDDVTLDIRHLNGAHHRDRNGDLITETFEAFDVEAAMADPVSLTAAEWRPSVSWAVGEPGTTIRGYFEDAIHRLAPLPEHQADEVRAQFGAFADPREQVAAVFRVAVDDTVDSGGYFSTPAAHAWSSGEGERLILLVGMLEALGYDPEVVFVRPHAADPLGDVRRSIREFELSAVRVPIGGGNVWLQPDYAHQPFDFLPLDAQGQSALVVYGRTPGRVIETPRWPLDDQMSRIEIDITASERGDAQVVVVEHVPRRLAANIRSYIETEDDQQNMARELEAAMSGSFPGVSNLSLELDGLDDPDAPLRMAYAFSSQGLLRTDADGLVWQGRIMERPFAGWYAASPTREDPLLVSIPLYEDLTIRWHAPDGMRWLAEGEEVFVAADATQFSRTMRPAGTELWMHRRTELPLQRVSALDYPGFAAVLHAMEDSAEQRVRLVR